MTVFLVECPACACRIPVDSETMRVSHMSLWPSDAPRNWNTTRAHQWSEPGPPGQGLSFINDSEPAA